MNAFDQFDAPSVPLVGAPSGAQGASAGNFFDQFDPNAPPAPSSEGAFAKPINVIGASPDGTPIFADPAQNSALAQTMKDTNTRMLEKGAEGVTFGTAPYAEAALTPGKSFPDALNAARAYTAETSKEMPVASALAEGIGSAIPTILSGVLIGPAESAVGRVAQGIGVGGALGGASAGGHDLGSGNTGSIGRDTLLGTGAGAVAGGAIPAATDMVASPITQWAARWMNSNAATAQAAGKIIDRIRQGASAGGPTAQDMLDLLALSPSKPLTIADVGSAPVQGMAGSVSRSGGAASQTATQFLNDRDVGAGTRLAGDVSNSISSGPSAFSTIDALTKARSAAATAPYETAMAGGSIAPLQDQLRTAVMQATAAKAPIIKQMNALAQQGQSGATGIAGAQIAQKYQALQRQLDQLEAHRQSALAIFQKSANDAATNAPGAVWNPNIQEFLDDPVMKTGLQRGMEIQRLESLAQHKLFDPTEYAITGTDAEGNPIVGLVPNMRTLDAGKRGLDAIVGDNRDTTTGRLNDYGRAVDQVRRSYVGELDNVNPDYAAARASWSGPSASMDAVRAGQGILRKEPDEVASEFGDLSPGDQEFYRLGAASTLKKAIASTGMGGDEAKRIVGNQWTQQQLRPLFQTQDAYDNFINSVGAENRMFETRRALIGGSDTARRLAEDSEGSNGVVVPAAQSAAAFMTGEPMLGMSYGTKAAKNIFAAMHGESPAVNAAASKMLFSSDPAANRALLLQALAAPAPRIAPLIGRAAAMNAGGNVSALAQALGPQ